MTFKGVKGWLQAEVMLLRRIERQTRGSYLSLGHFVLTEGRPWPRWRWCNDQPKGVPRECFRNAALLATRKRDLVYCEGYALRIIPVMHAWCVDSEGLVVDPTWPWEKGLEYYGIAIRLEYLRRFLVKRGIYGLLDAPERRWPLLSDPREEWRHPINDCLPGDSPPLHGEKSTRKGVAQAEPPGKL